MKNDKGNPQTPALIQTYNFIGFSALKTWFVTKSAAIAGGTRLCSTYTRFNAALCPKVQMGSVLPALPTRRTGVQVPLEERREKISWVIWAEMRKQGDIGRWA
eukprot:jgi/Botrbrau1/5331/Bobra.0346s0005.1